jgi:hypothetical protein
MAVDHAMVKFNILGPSDLNGLKGGSRFVWKLKKSWTVVGQPLRATLTPAYDVEKVTGVTALVPEGAK